MVLVVSTNVSRFPGASSLPSRTGISDMVGAGPLASSLMKNRSVFSVNMTVIGKKDEKRRR